MTIIEGNKLIAKYMGFDWQSIESPDFKLNELKYHSSWDALMPVVEKIEDYNEVRIEAEWLTVVEFLEKIN